MSLLCLNCRGCGRPEAVHEIHKAVDQNRPRVLFLSETRLSATRAQEICWGGLKRLSKGYKMVRNQQPPRVGGGVPFIENLKN
jgi:hypothetical protein